MIKAIIYTRVSTSQQAEEGTSLETQEASCYHKAKLERMEVIDVISDEGISGALYLSRPGIQEVLRRIEAGEAQALITYSISRTGRNVEVIRTIQNRLDRANARLVFADGLPSDNSAVSRLVVTQMGAFAEFERELIKERTQTGTRKVAESGRQPYRAHHPFGYHIVTRKDIIRGEYLPEQEGTYQIEETERPVVEEIFQRYTNGHTLQEIVRWLQDESGAVPHKGSIWWRSTVRDMLRNPVYKGEARAYTTKTFHDEQRLQEGMTVRYQRPAPVDRHVIIPAPAIIVPEEWEAVQERLSVNATKRAGNPHGRSLLGGFLKCPHCGKNMMSFTAMNKGRKYHYYTCMSKESENQPHPCKSRYLNKDKTEAVVFEALEAFLREPQAHAACIAAWDKLQRQQSQDTDQVRLERDLARIEHQIETAVGKQVEAAGKGWDTSPYDRMLDRLNLERQSVMVKLTPKPSPARNPKTALEKFEAAISLILDVLRDQSIKAGERRKVLIPLIQTITPYADHLLIQTSAGLTLCYKQAERQISIGFL